MTLAIYRDDRVESMTIDVSARAATTDEKLAAAADFARYTKLAADVFAAPGLRLADSNPRIRWTTPRGAVTIQNATSGVLVVWANPAHQDLMDRAGQS